MFCVSNWKYWRKRTWLSSKKGKQWQGWNAGTNSFSCFTSVKGSSSVLSTSLHSIQTVSDITWASDGLFCFTCSHWENQSLCPGQTKLFVIPWFCCVLSGFQTFGHAAFSAYCALLSSSDSLLCILLNQGQLSLGNSGEIIADLLRIATVTASLSPPPRLWPLEGRGWIALISLVLAESAYWELSELYLTNLIITHFHHFAIQLGKDVASSSSLAFLTVGGVSMY